MDSNHRSLAGWVAAQAQWSHSAIRPAIPGPLAEGGARGTSHVAGQWRKLSPSAELIVDPGCGARCAIGCRRCQRIAEPKVRIHSAPAESPRTIGSCPSFRSTRVRQRTPRQGQSARPASRLFEHRVEHRCEVAWRGVDVCTRQPVHYKNSTIRLHKPLLASAVFSRAKRSPTTTAPSPLSGQLRFSSSASTVVVPPSSSHA